VGRIHRRWEDKDWCVLCAESVREGRPREQGQKGWQIDLSSREKSKRINRNMKRKRNSKEKRRGEERKRHAPARDVE
jgi:hypothetical protein